MPTDQTHARRVLDARFERIRPLTNEPRPHRGWLRAIRDALSMSSAELAVRAGTSQTSVIAAERSEVDETIKLKTLRRNADALGCDVVYFLIPRTTLKDAAQTQARAKAADHLRNVAHHGRLEDQALTQEDTEAQLDELAGRFIDRRGFWSSD